MPDKGRGESIERPQTSGTTGKLIDANRDNAEAVRALSREVAGVSTEVKRLREEIMDQIHEAASSLITVRDALKEQATTSAQRGDRVLEAIRTTAETSAVREQKTLDTLTTLSTYAASSEEREARREAQEKEDRQRRLAREDEDREFELKQRERKAEEFAQLRGKLIWGAGAIITAIVGLLVALLAA